MNSEDTLYEIPYFEHKVINELMHAHRDEYGKALRAIVVFGKLKTVGGTFDIELLEVVDDWQGPARFQSESSAALPMRGKVYFHFLSTADFERFGAQDVSLSAEAREVLEQVLKGYEVIYQVPAGYAREMFQQAQAAHKAQSGGVFLSDPRRPSLLTRG